jgi:tripartite-type tricarboxylate transporter receptor subunit TctC
MKFRAALLCLAVMLCAAPAQAETIKIIVPFAAGGPVDQLARLLAAGLGPLLGADVIVEDKGGAGGAIGSEAVARAAPDGRTILVASLGSQVISPMLKPPAGYDPIKSFTPVMLVGSVPTLLVVGPKPGASTLKELIDKAKHGQAMVYGSAGPGTTMNIAGELFNAAAGLQIAHVPYRGAAPALTDLMGGQIDMVNADFPVLLPLVKAGKVKALALFGAERSPLLPDVPTTVELGLPDVIMENWYGVFLPAGASPETVAKLEKALSAVIAQPNVKERFATTGMHGTLGSAAFATQLAKEFPYWRTTVDKLGIKAGE